jgi:hypothetical protein
VVGYRIERISLPEYDYEGSAVSAAESEKAKPVVNRGGGRMGSKSAAGLSPEQLKELMGTG